MKPVSEEMKRRLPRLTISLVLALIFWITSVVVPPTLSGVNFPGFNLDGEFLVWIVTTLVTGIFLIRVLSDSLVLGDLATDIFVRRLGVKGKTSPKRALGDFIYIIIVILASAAISPLLSNLENIGTTLSTITTYIALGIILVLIYDIGRVLYQIIEGKADSLADRLVETFRETPGEGN